MTISASVGVIDEAFGREPQAPTPTVVVDVVDNGPGVPAELTDRIFNPFFTTKPQGSGLGLAIVEKDRRRTRRAHRRQQPGGGAGTRFRVTLPVTSASGWFK